MRTSVTMTFLISFAILINSQEKLDSVVIVGGLLFPSYTHHSERLSSKSLTNLLEMETLTINSLSSAKKNDRISELLLIAGGVFVGMSMGQLIRDNSFNWSYSGIGLGLVSISVPFSINATKKRNCAVTIYNSSMKKR